MSDGGLTKQITVTVEYNLEANQFHSSIAFTPGIGPEHFWEALKIQVITMTKMAPYFSDPVVREHVETGAKAMKLMALGIDSAIAQIKATHENLKKEFPPPS